MIVDLSYKQKSTANPNNLPRHCSVKKWQQQPHWWVNIYNSAGFISIRGTNVPCVRGTAVHQPALHRKQAATQHHRCLVPVGNEKVLSVL